MQKSLKERFWEFLRAEDGPTATEYAVMLALIFLVVITGVTALGSKVNTSFTDTANAW